MVPYCDVAYPDDVVEAGSRVEVEYTNPINPEGIVPGRYHVGSWS